MLFAERKFIDPELCKLAVHPNADTYPAGFVEGYASVFGNEDYVGDIVEPGAFTKTLKERLKKGLIKLYDSHRLGEGTEAVIGLVDDAKEDDYGLWFRAKFSQVERSQNIRTKIQEGILNAVSFGFDIVKDQLDEQKRVRRLKELKLYEISIVPWGANPKALVDGVKAVVSVSDFGLADMAAKWSGPQAQKRLQAWVSDAPPEDWTPSAWAKYRRGHLWVDNTRSDSLGGYYFPVVDVLDGSPKYVWAGVRTALAAVRGARGAGSGPWADDAEGIETQLKRLYTRFEQAFPEKGVEIYLPSDVEELEKTLAAQLKGGMSEVILSQFAAIVGHESKRRS